MFAHHRLAEPRAGCRGYGSQQDLETAHPSLLSSGGVRHINQAVESGKAPPRRQPLSKGHSSRRNWCGRGMRGVYDWEQAVMGQLCPQGRHSPETALHGGIKGEAEGLARKQWILEGIRHPSSYQQDLWTMVGSEVHTAHGH